MRNNDIRQAAKQAGIYLWQIADNLGINDGNLSRRLRKELTKEEKEKILEIIEDLAKKKEIC